MKKAGLLTISLLLATAMAVAQQSYPSSSSASSPDQTAVSQQTNANSVQGCLSGSDGNFTLTDQTGTMYTVQGDSAKLRDHVGHTVQISGTISGGATSDQTGTSATASTQKTIQLTDLKVIADSCKPTSATPQSDQTTAQAITTPASNPEQPTAMTQPVTPVTSETPAQSSALASSTPVPQSDVTPQSDPAKPPVTTDQNATAATQASTDESAAGDKNLPQTATPLPLLALLGLGSLSGGLLARKKK